MSHADTVRLIPFNELLDFVASVRRMRDAQKKYISLRGENPHMNLEPLYKLVRSHEADVDRRVREAMSRGHKAIPQLFAEGAIR